MKYIELIKELNIDHSEPVVMLLEIEGKQCSFILGESQEDNLPILFLEDSICHWNKGNFIVQYNINIIIQRDTLPYLQYIDFNSQKWDLKKGPTDEQKKILKLIDDGWKNTREYFRIVHNGTSYVPAITVKPFKNNTKL